MRMQRRYKFSLDTFRIIIERSKQTPNCDIVCILYAQPSLPSTSAVTTTTSFGAHLLQSKQLSECACETERLQKFSLCMQIQNAKCLFLFVSFFSFFFSFLFCLRIERQQPKRTRSIRHCDQRKERASLKIKCILKCVHVTQRD